MEINNYLEGLYFELFHLRNMSDLLYEYVIEEFVGDEYQKLNTLSFTLEEKLKSLTNDLAIFLDNSNNIFRE